MLIGVIPSRNLDESETKKSAAPDGGASRFSRSLQLIHEILKLIDGVWID